MGSDCSSAVLPRRPSCNPLFFIFLAAFIPLSAQLIVPQQPVSDMTAEDLREYRENLYGMLSKVEDQLRELRDNTSSDEAFLELGPVDEKDLSLLIHNMAKRDVASTQDAPSSKEFGEPGEESMGELYGVHNSSQLEWENESGSGDGDPEGNEKGVLVLDEKDTSEPSLNEKWNGTEETVPSIPVASTPTASTQSPPPPPITFRYRPAPLKQPVLKRGKYYRNMRPRSKCQQLSKSELVSELKRKGTYNPDFMAWDVPGVIRFLEKATTNSYDKEPVEKDESKSEVVQKNLAALERILKELNVLDCNVRSPKVMERLYNLTNAGNRKRTVTMEDLERPRSKRQMPWGLFEFGQSSLDDLYQSPSHRDAPLKDIPPPTPRSKSSENHKKTSNVVGQVHVVPFGCSARGAAEDGYLRLCGACQAIRRLPDDYFPPFINEVLCDDDKACLYFYDYPHGKCKQKHMNFVVLRNVGTAECQVWRKFNINVRVSCECFVDQMSFFAKYV